MWTAPCRLGDAEKRQGWLLAPIPLLTGLLLTLGLHADELGEVQAQHLLSFSFLACKHSGVCQEEELK